MNYPYYRQHIITKQIIKILSKKSFCRIFIDEDIVSEEEKEKLNFTLGKNWVLFDLKQEIVDEKPTKSHFQKIDSEKSNPLNIQIGGNHYKNLKIQPIEYCMENNLGACESAIIKYITRYKNKNGIEDLKKIKHYVDLLIAKIEKNEI